MAMHSVHNKSRTIIEFLNCNLCVYGLFLEEKLIYFVAIMKMQLYITTEIKISIHNSNIRSIEIMDIRGLVTFLLLITFSPKGHSTSKKQAMELANSVRVLVKATAKPGRLTVMACWNSGKIHKFNKSLDFPLNDDPLHFP